MHGKAPNVLGIFAAPNREDCLRAISRTLLRIRSDKGLTCAQIAKLAECSPDTIENATNEKSLLCFEAVARLGYFFPDEFGVVEELWLSRAAPEPTMTERLERLSIDLDTIRKLTGAGQC